ncbi:NrsF family protein [Leptospira sp. GIMC2001]|uniref:NrsF family protein n=1 Tax=Leptospira sp. GIMC2001 TaxID=1513297 RepID=UPI002349C945|nr:NrsF family protein [Leptospira sp. GIMC2001]WCL47584.1 NrsF family protein [Leptospira sp. GIMC2001]
MNRNEFIQALAIELRNPEKQLSKTPIVLFFCFGFFAMGLEIYLKPIQGLEFNSKTLFPITSFIAASFLLFFYTRPGDNIQFGLLFVAAILVTRFAYLGYFLDVHLLMSPKFWSLNHIFCPTHILYYSVPSFILITAWLKYRCSTNPYSAIFIGGVASAGLSEIILNLFCAASSAQHLMIWHFIPWIIPIAMGLVFARRLTAW